MFEVGFTEIILILGLALLVLGPEKLPALAEKVGRWTGRARAMARQLRTQLEHEVAMQDLAKSRPAQPAAEAPAADSHSAAAAEPRAGPDLDNMRSEIEAPPNPSPSAAAEAPTTKSPQ